MSRNLVRELRFFIEQHDADAMKHIEPARLIDAAIAALEFKQKHYADQVAGVEAIATEARAGFDADDLRKVRNAWVMVLGNARLQILGGG